MSDDASDDLRYPIGKASIPAQPSPAEVAGYIRQIGEMPALLRAAVQGLTDEQLDTPYRPGGWTVRQVVHHYADSHINSYVRFKLALTEDNPTIKPYFEERWAELPDARHEPVAVSLDLLDALHQKLVTMMRGMSPEDLKRTFVHPETGRTIALDRNMALYAWHGRHHVAHILRLKERMGFS